VTPPPDGGYPGENTGEGASALLHLSGGTYNTAIGWASLGFDVTGNLNTAVGSGTLLLNTADENTATGAAALLSNTAGFSNTANGAFALFSNSTGSNNTAMGYQTLSSNMDGFRNNAFGVDALLAHQTGNFNNAFGSLALRSDQSGARNNAFGDEALYSNVSGTDNTAIGDFALHQNGPGSGNTAIGAGALNYNITGTRNTAIGYQALQSDMLGFSNTAIGSGTFANLNGNGGINIAIGDSAGYNLTNGEGNIYIASRGVATEFGTTRIGDDQSAAFIGGIWGVTANGGTPVYINSDGQLGTISSSRRFKKNVRPMADASKTILTLNPVRFQYKNDKTNTLQFGLIAEDVAKVNPDLVVRDKNGEIYSVRYDQVNAMLLNEFLKEHKKLQEQEATINWLQKDFQFKLEEQQRQIETLRMGLKESNAAREVRKAIRQMASNNQ